MDVWEANSISNAFTPHGCQQDGPYECPSSGCSGQCDSNGCGYNAYGQGAHSFYGPSDTVDTTKNFTVVTQFLTDSSGALDEIRRLYIQNGVVIQNSVSSVGGNSITTDFCSASGQTGFATLGGMTPLTKAFNTGMVLAVSLWDDPSANGMSWLDGGSAGTCTGGVNTTAATVSATFSNIKFGDIGSTYSNGSTTTTTSKISTTTSKISTTTSKISTTTSKISTTTSKSSTTSTKPTSTTTSTAAAATQTHWGQCAGLTYTYVLELLFRPHTNVVPQSSGPTVCASPYTCTYNSRELFPSCKLTGTDLLHLSLLLAVLVIQCFRGRQSSVSVYIIRCQCDNYNRRTPLAMRFLIDRVTFRRVCARRFISLMILGIEFLETRSSGQMIMMQLTDNLRHR